MIVRVVYRINIVRGEEIKLKKHKQHAGDGASVRHQKHIEQIQQKQLHELLRFIWAKSAFYRELYQSHGITKSDIYDVSIEDLPIVSKQLLMDNFDHAVTDPRLRKSVLETWIQNNIDPRQPFHTDFIVVRTSGSLGETGIFVYDRISWQIMASKMAVRLPAPEGLPQKTRVAFYIVVHGNLTGIITALELPATVYEVLILSNLDPPERIMRELNQFQPQRLVGYSSSIAELAEWTNERRIQIQPQTVLVSGDFLSPAMYRKMRDAWRADIHVMYMASESIYLAVKKAQQPDMVVMEDLNILEVLDRHNRPVPPGSQGRVVLTNLYNRALPLLRYELMDYVVRGEHDQATGFSTIRDVKGRVDDALPIVLKDGQPGTLDANDLISFHTQDLEKIQFVSLSANHIRIDYVAQQSIGGTIAREFQRLLDTHDGAGTKFKVNRVNNIPNDLETGKLRLVRAEGAELGKTSRAFVGRNLPNPQYYKRITPTNRFELFFRDALEQSIPKRFEAIVQRCGQRPAIKIGLGITTYDELNRAANRIAWQLLSEPGTGTSPIGLLLDKDADLIAAILGVLKSGNSYICLDPWHADTHKTHILDDIQPNLLLTNKVHLPHTSKIVPNHCRVINIDGLRPSAASETNPDVPIEPTVLAYILYTSGTTDDPKGIMHTHESLLHACMTQTNDFHIAADDRLAFLHSIAFNPSVRDIFGALLNGACLLPIDVRSRGFNKIPEWLAHERVTILSTVPTIFRQIVKQMRKESCPTLRLLDLVGEPVYQNDIELFRTHFCRHSILVNSLGASECHVFRRFLLNANTSLITHRVPCGFPVSDKEVLILDKRGKELSMSRSGEIAVRSRYLSSGYWRKPALTKATFQTVPGEPGEYVFLTGDIGALLADGMLYHLGRADTQVKIRGQRVNTEDVRRAMHDIPMIKEVVVSVRNDKAGHGILAAYYVITKPPGPTVHTIRNRLSESLPDYMIPSMYVVVDEIPKTSSGKVDLKALIKIDAPRQPLQNTIVAPRSRTERMIATIWREVLDAKEVGIDNNFLDIGGHSLSAMRIIARIRDTFGIDLSVRDFLTAATIADIAELIDGKLA